MTTARSSPRGASGCRASSRPISACWRSRGAPASMPRSRPLRWPTRSAAARCRRRSSPPARAASPRIRRLAELVRKEQDLGKQINAQLGALNNVLSLPRTSATRRSFNATNGPRSTMRATATKVREDIAKRFPSYADLIDPKPPTVEQIRRRWCPAKRCCPSISAATAASSGRCRRTGRWRLRRSRRTSGDIESKVRKLREALEPQAATIADIPAFDLALAYELYSLLLQAGRGGVEVGQEPDRGDQRRARTAAAVAAADGAGRELAGRAKTRFCELPQGAVARAHPCRDHGAVGGGAADAAPAAAGLGRARAD